MPNAGTGDRRVLNLSPLCACREIEISSPRNTVIFDFILVLRERCPKESAKGYTLSKKSCRARGPSEDSGEAGMIQVKPLPSLRRSSLCKKVGSPNGSCKRKLA